MLFQAKRIVPLIALCAALLAGIVYAVPQPARAADKPSITIESELGFNGNVKLGEWNPLTITLTSSADISGELVVGAQIPYTGGSTTHIQAVDLPAGSPKKVTFAVLGNRFDQYNNSIRFYEGTAESGKMIPFAAGSSYLETIPKNGTLVGTLAADPDSLNFLRTLNGSGGNVTVVPLDKEQVPADGTLLSSLDVLLINDYSADTLGKGRTGAIRSWVHKGGTLILSGGAGYPKSAKGFEDLSPVDYAGNTSVSELPELEQLGGKKLPLDRPFPVSAAKLKEGAAAIAQFDSEPLIASWSVGQGKVIYAAYDVAMEPLNAWSGHPGLWFSVLQLDLTSGTGKPEGSKSELFSGIDGLLDYFPSVTLPPFSLLIWLLLGYAVLVAPLLYYILKKLDKREWAWVLIPLIAVAASGGIYMAGTSGGSSVQTHTFNIMELDGKGRAERTTASALFVPRGGDYDVELPAGTYVSVKREDGLLAGGQNQEPNLQSIRVQADRTTVKLKGMTHRSFAKLWMDQPEDREFGAVSVEAGFDGQGRLQGTVTNRTDADLSDAALIVGKKVFLLGELPKQQSVPIASGSMMVHYDDYGGSLFPYSGSSTRRNNVLLERQRGLVNSYLNVLFEQDKYLFIAWSKEQLSDYKVNGKSVKSDQLNMWVQRFEPALGQNGEMYLPYGFAAGRVLNVTSSQWSEEGSGRVNMAPGEMQIEYRLPVAPNPAYSQLSIAIRQQDKGTRTTAAIWNAEKEAWRELNWKNGEVKFADQANQYLQNGTNLRIRITAEEWTSFDIPELSLQGRYSE